MEPISIIVTHWAQDEQRSEIMRKCLRSLIATTQALPVEIIVVDNGSSSTDSNYLLGLVEDKKIHHYVRNTENLYFGFARNIGYAIASGNYIVFADNDIEYSPGWLEGCYTVLSANPDRKIMATPLRADQMHNKRNHWQGEIDGFQLNMRSGSNCWMVRRKDFENIGRFQNHRIAGTLWNDKFARAGYLMATMQASPLAHDIGFRSGYDHANQVEIAKILADGSKIILND